MYCDIMHINVFYLQFDTKIKKGHETMPLFQ